MIVGLGHPLVAINLGPKWALIAVLTFYDCKPLQVDKLEQACQKRGIKLQRDKKRIGYGGSIRPFYSNGECEYVTEKM
jgi:hypothetical protein